MTTVTTVFAQDTRTENFLAGHDIDYTGPVAIRISDIDTRASRSNQARAEALVDDAVDSYRAAIRQGDQLPAIILAKRGVRYVVVDGNNRLEAAGKERYDRVMAYVLSERHSPEDVLLLTLSANSTNGQPVPKSWKLRQAVTLVATGFTEEKIAAAMRLSVTDIRSFRKQQAVDERAARLGIRDWTNLAKQVRIVIGRLEMDSSFKKMADIAVAVSLANSTDLASTVAAIRSATSEKDQHDLIELWAEDAVQHHRQLQRMGRKRNSVSNPKLGLSTGLGKISTFDARQTSAVFRTADDRAAVTARIDVAAQNMIDIYTRLHGVEGVKAWLTTLGTKIKD